MPEGGYSRSFSPTAFFSYSLLTCESNDIKRGMIQIRADIKLGSFLSMGCRSLLPDLAQSLGRDYHDRDHFLDVFVRERRVQHLSLFLVGISLGQQDAVTNDSRKDPNHSSRLCVVVRVGVEHMLDRLGVCNQDALPTKETSIANNSTIFFDPSTMRDTGFLCENVEDVTNPGEVIFVVFGGVGWTRNVAKRGEEGRIDVGLVYEVRAQEGDEGTQG